ncbi:MAG: hypothetical protein NC328_06335 [Muribaculum sp.]|nr:hypothetical protein [Muribaculum sp.]
MANKRQFKKTADLLGAQLCETMMTAYVNVPEADKKQIGEAIGKVLQTVETAQRNANTFFDRGVKAFPDHQQYSKAKRDFFKALWKRIYKDFNEGVEAALKQFNAALPEDVKKAQKAAVN